MNEFFKVKLTFVMISGLWLISCNKQSGTSNENVMEASSASINAEISDLSENNYDPAMDLYLTGGEDIERKGDTLGIKMYVATMKPGDSAAWHSHPDHTVYVLKGGKLAVYFEGNEKQIMELPDGVALISPPLTDAAVNIGNTTIKMVIHDIYRPR